MVFNIIPFIVIIISFLIIVYIIGRKIPELKILEVETIAEEKESNVKRRILEIRWKRIMENVQKALAHMMKMILGHFFRYIQNVYKKILELDTLYKKEVQKRREENIDSRVRLENFLLQAKTFTENGQYQEAEDLFMKALEIDFKNFEAYQSLGQLYLKKRDYQKSKETFNFLLKLLGSLRQEEHPNFAHLLASTHATLGEIEKSLDDPLSALKNFKKAVEVEPHNPRFLDNLLNVSIMVKDKKLAIQTLEMLKVSDPTNQKLKDLEEQIEQLSE